jgi:hypothetical protein
MALCNYPQKSYFRDVFDPRDDFNWSHVYEIPESLQKIYDPVGYYFFHRRNVHQLLADLRKINKRVNLRDLLRDMDRLWRFNNQNHQILNEPDWHTKEMVAKRVNQLTKLTRARLTLQNRVENQVSTDVIRTWEYQEPLELPVLSKGTISGALELNNPRIMSSETPQLYANVRNFDKRIFIMGEQ